MDGICRGTLEVADVPVVMAPRLLDVASCVAIRDVLACCIVPEEEVADRNCGWCKCCDECCNGTPQGMVAPVVTDCGLETGAGPLTSRTVAGLTLTIFCVALICCLVFEDD